MISLRNDLPTCAMPNGGLRRASWSTFLKLMKMPCAVSGRRYAREPSPSSAPTCVWNIRLNWRASVRSHSVCSPGPLARPAAALRVVELVGAEAQLARAAVDERVGEAGDVAGRLPDARVEDDRGVERDDVVPLLHHRLEPQRADVVLHQHAVVAVVVRRAEAAVDLRRREDEAAPPRERHDLVHRHGSVVSVTRRRLHRSNGAPRRASRTRRARARGRSRERRCGRRLPRVARADSKEAA